MSSGLIQFWEFCRSLALIGPMSGEVLARRLRRSFGRRGFPVMGVRGEDGDDSDLFWKSGRQALIVAPIVGCVEMCVGGGPLVHMKPSGLASQSSLSILTQGLGFWVLHHSTSLVRWMAKEYLRMSGRPRPPLDLDLVRVCLLILARLLAQTKAERAELIFWWKRFGRWIGRVCKRNKMRGRMLIFIRLTLPVHVRGILFHSFRSFLILCVRGVKLRSIIFVRSAGILVPRYWMWLFAHLK